MCCGESKAALTSRAAGCCRLLIWYVMVSVDLWAAGYAWRGHTLGSLCNVAGALYWFISIGVYFYTGGSLANPPTTTLQKKLKSGGSEGSTKEGLLGEGDLSPEMDRNDAGGDSSPAPAAGDAGGKSIFDDDNL